MSIKTSMSWMVGAVIALALAANADAQHYQPFIDYDQFNYDMQIFAPVDDIDLYGGEPPQRTGWFGEYARMHLGVSKPDYYFGGELDLDATWGNRWDVGYMTEEDSGWMATFMHVAGPNAFQIIRQQRINRFNPDDEGSFTDGTGNSMTVEPPSDRNNVGPPDRERFYDIRTSMNVGDLQSFELNKVYRLDPLHNGGILEPFFGFRYARFRDVFRQDAYQRFDEDGNELVFPPGGPTTIPIAVDDADIEDYTTDITDLNNRMFGGQLGFRWMRRVNRWNLSTECRAFGLYNWQVATRTVDITRTFYAGAGQGADVDHILRNQFIFEGSTNAFSIGGDVRAMAAYEITRDLKLSVGVQFLGFTNVGRGGNLDDNREDLILVGSTFGVTWNH